MIRCRSTTPKDAFRGLLPWRREHESGERISDLQTNHTGEPRFSGSLNNSTTTIKVRPKNWLTPVALLMLREKSSHGYGLMERLAQFGFEQINPGTVYRALRKMEHEGLCESTWRTSSGRPPCRRYSVTEAGERYLESWAEGCKKYQPVLDSFFLAHSYR
jgi:poly-beta-hydroxybutyrate-responsive repressor